MSEFLLASDVNALRSFINYEVTRRGKTLSTSTNRSKGDSVKEIQWNQLRTNLAKCISVNGSATAGGTITIDTRNELKEKAEELYKTTVGKR